MWICVYDFAEKCCWVDENVEKSLFCHSKCRMKRPFHSSTIIVTSCTHTHSQFDCVNILRENEYKSLRINMIHALQQHEQKRVFFANFRWHTNHYLCCRLSSVLDLEHSYNDDGKCREKKQRMSMCQWVNVGKFRRNGILTGSLVSVKKKQK